MTERALKELLFNLIYARFFSHGTDGHNARMVMAEMAKQSTDQEVVLLYDYVQHFDLNVDLLIKGVLSTRRDETPQNEV